MASTRTQRLNPVEVPWMISPSVPHLRLVVSESLSDDEAKVTFISHFDLDHSPANRIDIGCRIVDSPYKPATELGPTSGPYQLVEVTFHRAIAARLLPAHSDSEVINPAVYDLSAVPGEIGPGQSIEEWLRCFQDRWAAKKLCPDPRMYEVAHSLWLVEIAGIAAGYKHFLLLGHDAYAEVIAQSFEWKSKGAV